MAALTRQSGRCAKCLSNGLIEKSVHDVKRAVGLLDRFNITLEGVKDDTFLAAYLLDPTRSKYELADLAREALGVENEQHSCRELARDCLANCHSPLI